MVCETFDVLREELLALHRRIKQLETRPEVKYCGVHRDGEPYTEASLVTPGGSLWLATETTSDIPGQPDSRWKLIVKRGEA
jgi:hypothetical protein